MFAGLDWGGRLETIKTVMTIKPINDSPVSTDQVYINPSHSANQYTTHSTHSSQQLKREEDNNSKSK